MTPDRQLEQLISLALTEDIDKGDITTDLFVSREMVSEARIIACHDATICGTEIVHRIFRKLDPDVAASHAIADGKKVKAGSRVMTLRGKTRALLTGERVALNFLSHLSAIATNTATFVEKVRPYKVEIVDTRKTTPGFRYLEKMAVKCAKGVNHRMNLYDMVLIKDNHHLIGRPELSLHEMITKARKAYAKPICIEVENLTDFADALIARPEIILLDNMPLAQIRQAVALAKKAKGPRQPVLEVSGGVDLDNIRAIARAGIRRVSIGALTHTKKNVNLTMEIVPFKGTRT